ncbi:MAG: cardiolipin synthase [Clostridia bacterium]|nr:cardiolipin synthase [Clostridia bacterium]
MKKLSARKKRWIERTVANDRSYKAFLYDRFFLFLCLVLLQLVGFGILCYLLVYHSKAALVLQITLFVLELAIVLSIINYHDRPSSRLNWIILILVAPVFGVPMYVMNGRGRPTRRMNKKIHAAKSEIAKTLEETYGKTEIPEVKTRGEAISRYLTAFGNYPAFNSGTVEYYKSGEEMFPDMLKEIGKAEKFILVEYFIIAHGVMWSAIRKALIAKAMQGVQIRIIYDDFGCMMTLPPHYEKYLESLHENIKCMTFNTVVPLFAVRMNNRDHRKMLVIDGKVAFTGGINLADEYIAQKRRFGYWKDTGLKLTGDCVRSFTQMFFYLWNAFRKDGEDVGEYLLPPSSECERADDPAFCVQPYDDSPLDRLSTGEAVYVDMINRATKSVWIFTPYLILDDILRASLCGAAMRGVDVRIVTPGVPDKAMIYRLTRANYAQLMKAGVRIYEYTPGFIHAKSMLCDDECAVVGTINLDYRSLYHHFENAVYFSGCSAVSDLKRDCEETFALSRECTPENTKRSMIGRLVDSVLRVFETLL